MQTGKPYASFSYCNSNFDKLNALIVNKRRKRHRSQLSPWVTQTTSNMIKKLYTVKRNQPGNYEKIKLRQRSCERSIEQDRANFESRLANTRSTSKLFKYFQTFKSTCIPNSVSYINESATDSKSQCRLFSKFFASIFTVSSNFVPVEEVEVENPLLDFDVSQIKIRSVCENLDVTKAVGPDGIPPIVFKLCAKNHQQSHGISVLQNKANGCFSCMLEKLYCQSNF